MAALEQEVAERVALVVVAAMVELAEMGALLWRLVGQPMIR
jgi:hypothetical protein